MKPRTRTVAVLAASLAAALLAAVLYGIRGRDVNATAEPPAVLDKLVLAEGRPPAPDVTFFDAMDAPVRLSDYRGRYVLVNLWATWCGPCIIELPDLARLQRELPQDRITVVPVDVLERLDGAKLAEFLAMHGAGGLPVYIDKARSVQRGFMAHELPLTVLIDDQGREVARAAGGQKWADPAAVAYLKAISAPAQ